MSIPLFVILLSLGGIYLLFVSLALLRLSRHLELKIVYIESSMDMVLEEQQRQTKLIVALIDNSR